MRESSIDLFPARSAQLGSPEPGTAAICFVAAALESVRARGMVADGLLSTVGPSPTLPLSPHPRVSAEHHGKMWRLIALTVDDDFLVMPL